MLTWTDRIYGQLDLPESVRHLAASCPLVLRLREVRMPNVPFLTFPSFAGVSRYEHSIGVAHLAWWWARRVGLAEDDAEALTMAALYHDAATPALSHLFEEFLRPYGFDHEVELSRLLNAESSIPGRSYAQVFLGHEPLLRRVLAIRGQVNARLSTPGIVRLSRGDDVLGRAIHGDLDLDNIDNVLRATTAMGLIGIDVVHPYEVASELTWEDGEVRLTSEAGRGIALWRSARRLLYDAILHNRHEFLAQAALKWAIDEYAVFNPDFLNDPRTWTLTEPELVFEHLRTAPRSRELVDRLRLGRVPELLATAWIKDASELTKPGGKGMVRLIEALRADLGPDVYANYYLDKRERSIRLAKSTVPTLFEAAAPSHRESESYGPPSAVIGIVGTARARRTKRELIRAALESVFGIVETVSLGWLGEPTPAKERRLL